MRHLRRALAVAGCCAVVAPATALAGTPHLLGNVSNAKPTVTAGPDGAFHAVFNDGGSNLIVYCRITPASIAGPGDLCTQRTVVPFNDMGGSGSGEPGKAWIVADEPGVLRLALAQYVSGKSYVWTSTDNGASFAGPTLLSDPNHGTDSQRPLLLPAVQSILFPTWNTGAFVSQARLDGSEAAVDNVKATLSNGGQSFLIYNFSLGATGDSIVATADNLDLVAFWRLPAGANGNDSAAWGAPTVISAGTDSTMHSNGVTPWVGYTAGTPAKRRFEMRPWTGAAFGPPKIAEATAGYLADVYVAGNGVPGAAYRRNGTGLRFAQLRPGATKFTVKTVVRNDDIFHDLVVAHDGNNRGIAVWSKTGAVYAADLTEVFDPSAPRVSITQSKGGITLGLNMPGSCVLPGKGVKLSTSGQGKARLLQVRYRLGPVQKLDLKAPWGAVLKVPATAKPGASLPVKAIMKLRKTKGGKPFGPPFSRTIVASLRVCGG